MNSFDFNEDNKAVAQPVPTDANKLMEELEEANNRKIEREVTEEIANKSITKTYVLLKETIDKTEKKAKENKKFSIIAIVISAITLLIAIITMVFTITK